MLPMSSLANCYTCHFTKDTLNMLTMGVFDWTMQELELVFNHVTSGSHKTRYAFVWTRNYGSSSGTAVLLNWNQQVLVQTNAHLLISREIRNSDHVLELSQSNTPLKNIHFRPAIYLQNDTMKFDTCPPKILIPIRFRIEEDNK